MLCVNNTIERFTNDYMTSIVLDVSDFAKSLRELPIWSIPTDTEIQRLRFYEGSHTIHAREFF